MLRPRSKSNEATDVPSRPASAPAGRPFASDPEKVFGRADSLTKFLGASSAHQLGAFRVHSLASPTTPKPQVVVGDHPNSMSLGTCSSGDPQQQQQQQQLQLQKEKEEDQQNQQQSRQLEERGLSSQVFSVEEERQSPQGSTEASETDYSSYWMARASMPRNFQISLDGYTLEHDAVGTYCAYRINVTAGLHQWRVLRRYRQFLALHAAVSEHVRREDMPNLPGKRILGSSIDPSFAEARGLALQVYLRQLVRVRAAWRTPLLIAFLDTQASTMGMQSQISSVLDQADRMESLCVDLQHQLNLSQMQVETLCRRLQTVEREYAVLQASVQKPPDPSPIGQTAGEQVGSVPSKKRASTGPTIPVTPGESFPSGVMRRMSSGGFAGTSLPADKIDFSDLNNVVKRVESANQLAMKVASDDEDDAVDQLLEHQHQMMRSSSAYSLTSIDGQSNKGLMEGDDKQESLENEGTADTVLAKGSRATPAITIPSSRDSMPSKVWDRLKKESPLLGDLEERMMAEGQDESTPGSGLVKDISRSMFGLGSPPCPSSATRWPPAGLKTRSAMFGVGNTASGPGEERTRGVSAEGDVGYALPQGTGVAGPSEVEEDPLPLDVLPFNTQPLAIDRRVDDLLKLLRPTPRAEGYRRSVFRFVTRQVKRALGAQCFPVGGYAIQAYLPDEEVGISAFLCHGQEKSWFVRVNETLCKVSSEASEEASEGGIGDASEGVVMDAGGGGSGGLEGEDGSSYRHRLSNVNFINMGHLQKIKCVVDNQVAVDIGANQVGEIATVALLEETDQLLGKNHLFKRSLLLIKSWWVYESRAYTGSNMLSRITESALATMVLAVVNQHHARLHTPLQVIAMFFHMQSRFDWSKYCWCIEGPRRLDTLHMVTPSAEGTEDAGGLGEFYGEEAFGGSVEHPAPLLLSQELLERYRLRHAGRNRQGLGGRKSPVTQGSGTQSTADHGELPAGVCGGGVTGGGGEIKEESARKFPIRNMNVMNPLDSTDNQIDDTVNRRRAARMHSLLQMGARLLRPVLMHFKREITKTQQGQPGPPHAAQTQSTSVGMLEAFFSLSWARFGQGWRPDIPPHLDRDDHHNYHYNYHSGFSGGGNGGTGSDIALASPGPTPSSSTDEKDQRDPFYVDLESVRDSVKYCCFLLEAEVTDSALLALSKEILAEKGSLPVGEIGKLLQEATANASLSQTLKDQFGGLKKFLEKHPGEFAIAADHPFNPHVYLKSALTPEEFDTVMRGGIVIQTGTSGAGGAKKHKSKSSRRRSAANKQAAQQQQQQHLGVIGGSSMMHSGGGGGGGMSQKAHQGHFLRASHHPTISHHQQQQRALSNPRYGPQQDKLQDIVHDAQLDHQQQSVLRQGGQGHRQGEGGRGSSLGHNLQQQRQQMVPSRGEVLGQHVPAPAGEQGHRQHYRIQHHFQQQQQSARGLSMVGSFIGEDRRDRMPGGTRVSSHHQQQQLEQRHRQQQQQEEDSLAAMYLQQSAETLAAGDPFLSQRGRSTGRGRTGGGFGGLDSDAGMRGISGALRHDHYDQQLEKHQQRGGVQTAWDDTLVDVLQHSKGVLGGGGLRNEELLLEDASRQRGVEFGFRGQGETGRVFGSRPQRLEAGDDNDSSPGLLYKPLDQHQEHQQQQQQRLNRQLHQLQHGGGNSPRVDQGLGGLLSDLRDDSEYFS